MDLVTRIDSWSGSLPDRPAHISGASTLTYAELKARSDALALHLADILPDDR